MSWEQQLQVVGEVALAMLLGAVIGFERETANRPAGLRTHMLVAGAAALLTGLAGAVVTQFAEAAAGGLVEADPIRVIQAIIAGISFLGAGTILRSRRTGEVEGLTTAASILFAAAVGIAVALLQLVLAVGSTLLALATLRGLRLVSKRLRPPDGERKERSNGATEPPRPAEVGRSRGERA